MSQEILSKLMGKAGDVVRIKLRNNKSIDHTRYPHMIFDILKQHFSELTYSSMPLADFYSTLPKSGEDAMEFWIRLNRTVEVADECLRRQGRSIEDPSHEVSMMFIKHCPDQSLANVFKFKSARQWSACEIQERLDEHMQDRKSRTAAGGQFELGMVERRVRSQCHVPLVGEAPVLSAAASASPTPFPAPPDGPGGDHDYMRSLVGLLDRLVTVQTQVPASATARVPDIPRRLCRVCNSPDHSTLSHCRGESMSRMFVSRALEEGLSSAAQPAANSAQ